MIKVSVMYPSGDGIRFDIDYYCNKHVPLVVKLLGDALKAGHVDSGLAGGGEGEPPAFIAMGHLTFDSVESFQEAFGPVADTIMGDIPNYTNSNPVIQISDIKI